MLQPPGRPAGPRFALTTEQREAVFGTAVFDAIVLERPTAADTFDLGRRLAGALRAGDLIVLDGPLGAGKTVFVQGIGAGLAVEGEVVSPTFVIARLHPGRLPLVHVDAYRMGSLAEVDELDLDIDAADAVTAVEWGAGRAEQLSEARLLVTIERPAGTETRTISLVPHGGDWATRLSALHL